MKIFEIMPLEMMLARAQVKSKDELLEQVAGVAATAPGYENISAGQILAALKEREKLGSTGFGKGIAIPHCRIPGAGSFVMGMVSVPDGIEFDSMDGEKVRLAVFLVGPEGRSQDHIRLLSVVSQALNIPSAVDEIVGAANAEIMRENFLRHVIDEVDTSETREQHLFQVVVQNEEYLHDVLEVLTAMPESEVVVLDGKSAAEYLSGKGLFAGVWADREEKFFRVVLALVNKKLTNETIRRIEYFTGKLSENPGVMIIVQDVFFVSGSLESV